MIAPSSGHSLKDAVILFGRRLRQEGLKVTPARLEDVLRGLAVIQVGNKAQFRSLLRANLVSSLEEMALFDSLFEAFWENEHQEEPESRPPEELEGVSTETGGRGGESDVVIQTVHGLVDLDPEAEGEREEGAIKASLEEVEIKKNFSQVSPKDLRKVEALVLLLARWLGHRLSRRCRPTKKAERIDFRRSLRRALRHGGELLELHHRRPKPARNRIHLMLDVSGSMDVYGHLFLFFMYGLQKCLSDAQCFVFSTHLTRVSPFLRGTHFQEAWAKINSLSVNWSGGTDLGTSFMQFYTGHLRLRAGSQIVIIVSDGWDRGSPEKLDEAMGLIRQNCRHLIWLNPLLAAQDYEPTCRGMCLALRYVDMFLPFHNLESLVRLTKTIDDAWAGQRTGR
jgi:uncharacterized protein with von Willebrand factor type A (vWA) domain